MSIPVLTQASAILAGRPFQELAPVFGEASGFFGPSGKKVILALEDMCKYAAEIPGADAVLLLNYNANSAELWDSNIVAFGMAIKYTA